MLIFVTFNTFQIVYIVYLACLLCTLHVAQVAHPLTEFKFEPDWNVTVYPIGSDYREHSELRFIDDAQRSWFVQNFVAENDFDSDQYGLWYPTRYRRQLPTSGISLGPQLMAMIKPTYVIRLAVFYDQKLSQMHNDKQKLNSFIRGILQQVQLIYRYRSMQTRIRIQVLSIEQVNGDRLPDAAGGEVDSYLDSFCAWQRLQHSKTPAERQWDHAILLTGERLYRVREDGQKDFKVLGMAWVNGMCNINLSCTLQEAESFEASFTIAHEMGHSLGILHDGRDNNCDYTRYLMSNTTGTGKVHWSPCSNTYLRKFLQSKYGNCLQISNKTIANSAPMDTKLPGEQHSPNSQCLMARGSSAQAYLSRQQPFDNVCRMLWCRVGSFAFATHPALEGSKCSVDGQCYQGECISKRSPRFMAYRREAFTAIKDLMQMSPSNRLNNATITSGLQSNIINQTHLARMEKKRPVQHNKAKTVSLARNADVKKNNNKKRIKSSQIAGTSVLKTNQSTSGKSNNSDKTGNNVSTNKIDKQTTDSKQSINEIQNQSKQIDAKSINMNNHVQPKFMNELKTFFRSLTKNSQGFFNMFKNPAG